MPEYNISKAGDRLSLALSFPTKQQRIDFIRRVRRDYGHEAAEELKAGLRDTERRLGSARP